MSEQIPRISKGAVLALTCAAQFMVVLDIAIVNVALPSIQDDLGVGQSTLQWVVIAYGLLLGGFLMFGGRLADLIGRRRILVAGLAIFSAASLLAGLSQIGGVADHRPRAPGIRRRADRADRAVDPRRHVRRGAGAQPCARHLRRRGRHVGIDRRDRQRPAHRRAGLALGVLHQRADRRVADRARRSSCLARDSAQRSTSKFDAAGATTITGGLLLLVYALNRGADHGWTSARRCRCSVSPDPARRLRAVESRSQAPLVPAAALRHRTLVAANLSAFFTFGAFFSFIFLGSLLMQQVLGYSPTKTGVSWLATSVTAFLASGLTGARLVNTVGVRKLLVTGLTLLALAMLWLARVPADADYVSDLLPAFLLAGVAIGSVRPVGADQRAVRRRRVVSRARLRPGRDDA